MTKYDSDDDDGNYYGSKHRNVKSKISMLANLRIARYSPTFVTCSFSTRMMFHTTRLSKGDEYDCDDGNLDCMTSFSSSINNHQLAFIIRIMQNKYALMN